MRPIDNTISYLLGDRGRTRLLVALCDPTRDRLWMREAGRQARLGMAGLCEEINTLQALGLVRRRAAGGARFLVTDTSHPLHDPLTSLIEASARLDEQIAAARTGWPFVPHGPGWTFPNADRRAPEAFDPFRWLDGDAAQPPTPSDR